MAIAILSQAIFDRITNATTYTVPTFTVPSGTSRLLVHLEYRSAVAIAPLVSTLTHNANAVSVLFTNAAVGAEDINTWWGERQNPDIGTFDIVVNFSDVCKGLKLWILALSGEKASGSILGATDAQRNDPASTDTVGLGLTPTGTGSLLLASLSIAQDTTLVSWTGTGFVEVPPAGSGTDLRVYTTSLGLTSTVRYRLNAPSSANTVSATFAIADIDIGGSLIEILAEATTSVDVSGNLTFGLSLAGTAGIIAGGSSARFADGSYRLGRTSWSEVVLLQPDVAGVNQRIITAGPSTAPQYWLEMATAGAAASNIYRWRYRLADGIVVVETGAGTQSATAHVIAMVHQPGDPVAYVNGIESVSSRTGNLRIGQLDFGAGGIALGGHDQASPAPFTGLIGRYLVYDTALTPDQVRLLSQSLLDPDSLWGYGSENDAQVTNRSPVAMPMLVEPDGRPSMTITPPTIDPDGTQPTITSVSQGVHTAVAISGSQLQLVLTLERGWQGVDGFNYTVGDGFKFSTAKVLVDQRRPALLARNDAITVQADGSILFDPRSNDIGAGTLRVLSVTSPSAGTAVLQADGRILYTPGA